MKQAERAANRQRWQAEVEAWRTSGKPLSVWARERNLSRDALEYWKRRIPAQRRARLLAKPNRPLTLIPIQPVLPAAVDDRRKSDRWKCKAPWDSVPIELIAESRPGLRIRLAAGFDAASLARLLDLLESRC
jgi:hypothetical protein